jgi:5-methylcytosine-specific restriction enzyme B
MLDSRIVKELQAIQQSLSGQGLLPSQEKLNQYYAAFRDRFGPERLAGLDGENLLITMHGLMSSNRDTMAYWLEFKNDEEFPAIFGGIGGGSALKWGVYPDAKTGQWMSRGLRYARIPISLEQAIAVARKHREQLAKGVELLTQLPRYAGDQAYEELQRGMNTVAPDVNATAWGHKYFSLLFPDKLDDYHTASLQRFHLVRLLQQNIPAEKAGRYIAAGRYVTMAAELETPINHFTTILNARTKRPYRYWRVVASSDIPARSNQQYWPSFLQDGMFAIDWAGSVDMSVFVDNQAPRDEVRKHMTERFGVGSARWTSELYNAVAVASEGDIIYAMDGDVVKGVGRITGPYHHEPSSFAPHQRKVEWLNVEPWTMPDSEGKGSIFREFKDYANQVEGERRILGITVTRPAGPELAALTGRMAQIDAIVKRKGQVILYGPPGTGKTYAALSAARELAARAAFQKSLADLTDIERAELFHPKTGPLRLITFHPSYGYEEFIEGYRPDSVNGELHFVARDGIFKRLCIDAASKPERRYFLVIDEINRGDIPRIFGELLTLLEMDKRGQPVLLPVTGQTFTIPSNVFVIATMNTADRSIALLDTALRRRFGFIELLPDVGLLGAVVIRGIPLGPWLAALNRRVVDSIGRDARNLQIGHAYLMEAGKPITDFLRFARVLQEDIIPLLEEYCYDDYSALEKILGSGLVDAATQCIRHELFFAGREDVLIAALLEPMPELTTTIEAISVVEEPIEPEDGVEEDKQP